MFFYFIYTCNDNDNGDNDDIINRIFISIYILFIHVMIMLTMMNFIDNNYYAYIYSKNGLLFTTFFITGFKSTIYKILYCLIDMTT